MRRTRPIAVLTTAAGLTLGLALGGCSTQESGSRVAVLGGAETAPSARTPLAGGLGAGDALGGGLHEVILARTAGGAAYATVTDDPGRP